jgi:hydroxymethylpyrimidine pyrophosphatase-like HAD family hydrolase
VLASDIDRTLLWSHKRLGDVPLERLTCLEVLDGRDWAYVTRDAYAALARMADTDALVLCTTRTPAQVQRLRLPPHRRVLCLNGGALLRDGEPDAAHAAHTETLVAQRLPMAEFAARVEHLARAPHVRSLRDADGAFGYFLLNGEPVADGWVDELEAIAAEEGWRLTHEQTKVYAMPDTLTKEAGLTRLLETGEAGDELVAAAGDSRLDEGMLRLARHALVPRGAYLESHGWDGALTSATGVLAGEEIALWLESLA